MSDAPRIITSVNYETDEPICTCSIMGEQFRAGGRDRIASFTMHKLLILKREPHNSYDSNAIMVIDPRDQMFIGYVAKGFAEQLAPIIDRGQPMHARTIIDGQKLIEIWPSDCPGASESPE